MTLTFCPGNKADGGEKDTLANCKPIEEGGTGEFVVNLAIEPYARQVAAAAEELAPGDSEFDLTGLTPLPSRLEAPPRVGESPFAFECRTTQVLRTNPGQPAAGNLVVGEVVYVHAQEELLDDRMHVDAARLRAIGRMGGLSYCTTRDRFELPRGKDALEADDPFFG